MNASSNKSTLLDKALQDPWYQRMVVDGCSEDDLLKAGFFEDGLAQRAVNYPWFDVDFPTAALPEEHEGVVLLSTGAFSPIHQGHLDMMTYAKQVCEQRGQPVIAGYMSPSHDVYVSCKYNGTAFFPAWQRLHWIDLAVQDIPWLRTCAWESVVAPTSLNFTDVIERMQRYLERHGRRVRVVYVFGEDNRHFANAFESSADYVCVPRSEVSSSAVRLGRHDYLPRHVNLSTPSPKGKYILRSDISESLEGMGLSEYAPCWEHVLSHVLRKYISKDLVFESRRYECLEPTQNVLSLDPWIQPSGHTLETSRFFRLGSMQAKSKERGPRPGAADIATQLTRLKASGLKNWVVLDDDIATGSTMRYVAEVLQSIGHRVTDTRTLLESDESIWDMVDARDFLIGAQHGGLVVELERVRVRVPYMYPYVQLGTRAKIPWEHVVACSLELWAANHVWWSIACPDYRVSDLYAYHQLFWRSLGYDDTQSIAQMAEHEGLKLARTLNVIPTWTQAVQEMHTAFQNARACY